MKIFSPIEVRVLGCLVEKEATTPENYPLSLNALTNACNQKSSRDPVMSLEEMDVLQAVARLRDNDIVLERSEAGSRVPKYAHRFDNLIQATPAERAVLCVLFLRGPQTPGEIRGRSGRLHEFRDPAEVETVLQALMTRADGPIVTKLPRQTGFKESRYAHLFSGAATTEVASTSPSADELKSDLATRLSLLETRVAALERQVQHDKPSGNA